jgi:hypothetical protein
MPRPPRQPSTPDDVSAHTAVGKKILIVTTARPTHRIACSVQSFTADQLICKAPFGATRVHKSADIAALITPDDEDVRLRIVLALNGASAAAAWGTLILAPVCIPCAVATGVVAAALFFANGAILMADGQPETLLYLAPNQQLQIKLRY